jgi:hypothetical protein
MKRALAAMLLAGAALQAGAAAPIYRCGNEYSQTPCPEGRLIESADPRSAAQRADARKLAALERKRAAEMARERRAREAAAKASAPAAAASPIEATKTKRVKLADRVVPLKAAASGAKK